MKHVRLSIAADGREDEIHPVYGLLVNASYIEYATALNWNFTGDELAILHYLEGDTERFERAIEDIPVVLEYDLKRAGDGKFYVYIRDQTTPTMSHLFEAFTDNSLVIAPPIEYREGTVTMSLFGSAERIQSAFERVPDFVTVRVEEISGLQALPGTIPAMLSDRQRDAVETAVALGYYEVPREASHEEVAAAMECAPSTAAEHLRKAESKLLTAMFDASSTR